MILKRAVFFDRDNTIIRNVPYNGDPSKVEPMPGAADALQKLREKGFSLFIISNQSGVGRGLITKQNVQAVNEEMHRQLGQNFFDGIYMCYASPEDTVDNYRKPSPEMILQAAKDHGITLEQSFVIGDRACDIGSGIRSGCRTVLLKVNGQAEPEALKENPDYIAQNLEDAVTWILDQKHEHEDPR